jgi:sterol desaturase/sphingolipid hydroxylase (fatty acid hydroxylase superfamily)
MPQATQIAPNNRAATHGPFTEALGRLVARIPADFGRSRPEIHYWLFAPLALLQFGLAARTGRITLAQGAGLVLAGTFAWTLAEYFIHRFSFHSTSEHPLVRPFNSGLHRLHHDQPSDRLYTAAPVALALPAYSLFFAAFWLISQSLARAAMIGTGFAASFLFYEFCHYSAHLRAPKLRYLKRLKRHHMLHHFADERTRFGVTSALWDRVFKTLPPDRAPARR